MSPTPVQVSGISNATSVSAGGGHTCTVSGTLTCLGNATRLTAEASSEGGHTCALRADSTVACWGRNNYGQLGNGGTSNSSTPVPVVGVGGTGTLSSVAQISVCYIHTCAIVSGGAVDCCGKNNYGQLGNGGTSASSTPVPVVGVGGAGTLSSVTQISAGGFQTCSLLSDHTVDCWGLNDAGQLGTAGTSNSSSPVQVEGIGGTGTLSNATQISAGESHICALLSGDTVSCWGYYYYGQIGNGVVGGGQAVPVQVPGIATAASISASGGNYPAQGGNVCAILSDGTVKCWGHNDYGQLGDGTVAANGFTDQVKGVGGTGTLADVTQVSVSYYNTCALIQGGTIDCWGDNGSGQLGDGVADHGVKSSNGYDDVSPTPVQVSGISTAIQVSVGWRFACALLADQTVKCWGVNWNGQLGDGTTTSSSTPVQVVGVGGTGTLSNVTQISTAGDDPHICALISGGTVKCWGENSAGQLGNGTKNDSSTPVTVVGVGGTGTLSNVTQLSSGGSRTCAQLSNGAATCWGQNYYGGLGDGLYIDSSTPVAVSVISNVVAFDPFGWDTCALLPGGTVSCYGFNYYGELGGGTTSHHSVTPIQVVAVAGGTGLLTGVTQLSANCVLLSDHTVACWGDDPLGNGTSGSSSAPAIVVNIP